VRKLPVPGACRSGLSAIRRRTATWMGSTDWRASPRGECLPARADEGVAEVFQRAGERPDLGRNGVTRRRIGDLRRKIGETLGAACTGEACLKNHSTA